MKRYYLMTIVPVLALAFCASRSAAQTQAAARPNIIFIVTDDQGYADLSSYGAKYKTPHIDDLAGNGLLFTDYYTPANVCTPSRAGLLTGSYPERIGITKVFFPSQAPEYARGKDTLGLNADEQTIAELLKDNGYATACAGKWHLGHRQAFLPLQHGFDEFYGIPYSHDMYPGNNAAYPPLPLIKDNKVIREGVPADQLTGLFTEYSVDYIERHQKQPFFLYLAYSMPHVPLAASKEFEGKTGAGLYADVINEIDASVGRIMNALKKYQLEENTLVIFTSDNGPWTRFGNHGGSPGPFREGKGSTFDGGHRVPLIMQWKKGIPPGSRCSQPVSGVDILPTLVGITGSRMPDRKIDGHDLSTLLKDPAVEIAERPVFCYAGSRLDAVRMGPYKYHFRHPYDSLVEAGKDGRQGRSIEAMEEESLYDLINDPGESRNLIHARKDIAEKLRTIATTHIAEIEKHKRPGGSISLPGTVTGDRKLIWHDEFDGSTLDKTKWNIANTKRRKDPDGKDAWWDRNNCYLDNKGSLVIRTTASDSGYAGGAVNTRGKFEHRFGYYEAKVKMQSQEGHWGAFWLFTQSVNQVGDEGRDGTEIDIFECAWVGKGIDKVQSAFHYDGYGKDHKKANQRVTGMNMNDGDWHIFGCEWTETGYKFYYDDKLVWESAFGGVSRVPQHIILSDEIGLWDGTFDIRKASLPDYMEVDYVRVYDKR